MKKNRKAVIMRKMNVSPSGIVVISELWSGTDSTLETANLLQKNGRKGKPLCDDMEALKNRHADEVEAVVNDWALFALTLIEACHNNEPEVFRRIYDELRQEPKHKRTKAVTALVRAASKAGRQPTDLEVLEEAKKLGSESGCQDLKELKKNLASQGFPIESSRSRGRPKKPK